MWAMQIVGSLNKVLSQVRTAWGEALCVINYKQAHGLWKCVTWTNGTVVKTTIVAPREGGSIEITDLIIATDKVQNAVVTLAFEDGTNTETLIVGDTTDAPLQIAHAVGGRFQSWRNAILKYTITGGNSTGTIIIGYIFHPSSNTDDYSVWNSNRR